MKTTDRRDIPAFYEFKEFRLDTREQLLFKDGKEVHLTPKAFEILLALLKKHGHVVEKDDLLQEVWPETIVEENNLTRTISTLRKILSEDMDDSFIETIPKRGYRFIAGVRESEESADDGYNRDHEVTGSELNTGAEGYPPGICPNQPGTANIITLKSGRQFAVISRFNTTVMLIILTIAAGLMALLYRSYQLDNQTGDKDSFPGLSLAPVTVADTPIEATISHDGKYIVYTSIGEFGWEGINLGQVDSDRSVQLVPPAAKHYEVLRISPDGEQIYFTQRDEDQTGTLYRMDLHGEEPPQKAVSLGLSSAAALSPDGMNIAFIRSQENAGISSLLISGIDGSSERVLLERNHPQFISLKSGSAWSLDGKTIACIIGTDQREPRLKVAIVGVSRGAIHATYDLPWLSVRQVDWLPDRRGLILLADENAGGWHNQFWFMSIPQGKLNRVTNDLTDYTGFSLNADHDSLITVQRNNLSEIWVVPHLTDGLSSKITSYNDRREGLHGIDWTPDGRIVFSSINKGHLHIWIMNSDGTQRTQLSNDALAESNHLTPNISPDGRHLVYVSERQGKTQIWRMDIDGNHQRPLTEGLYDLDPKVSSDGKWVVFSGLKSRKRTIWRVPITGGKARQVTDHSAYAPAPAPFGRLIACAWPESGTTGASRLAIIDPEGGSQPAILGIPFPTRPQKVEWMPDGRSLTFNQNRNGISNIWSQSVTGGRPAQVTDLSFENVASFAWSRDGKRLAIVRSHEINNLVIIRGLN